MNWLTDMDDTSIERQSRLPSSGFFFPNDIEEERDREEAVEAAEKSDAVVLTDPDADGLGAVLAIRQKHPDAGFIECGPHSNRLDLEDGLEIAAEHIEEGASVYVADICPDELDDVRGNLDDVQGRAGEIRWWDHHEWDDSVREYVLARVDELVINEGDHTDDSTGTEKCAAEISRDRIATDDVDFPATIDEAIEVTGVYDCWRKETDDEGNDLQEFVDERARALHEYAEVAEPEEYFATLTEFGADVMDDEDAREAVESHREKNEKFKELVVDRARFHEIPPWTVAVTYGRGPTNDIADDLKEQGVDLVVLVKPSGGVSFRGATEGFEQCAALADEFDGGGHDRAAGCYLAPKDDGDYDRWDTDMLDFSDHWLTNGERTRKRVLDAVEDLAEEA